MAQNQLLLEDNAGEGRQDHWVLRPIGRLIGLLETAL